MDKSKTIKKKSSNPLRNSRKKVQLVFSNSNTSSNNSTSSSVKRRIKKLIHNVSKKRKEKKTVMAPKPKKVELVLESSSSSSTSRSQKKPNNKRIETSSGSSLLDLETNLKIAQEVTPEMPKRLNEEFTDIMGKLASITLKQGEPFKSRAYDKARATIKQYPDDILNPEQLKGQPGIGVTIMEKLKEYTETGTLKVLEREKNNPVNIFAEIYGVGPKKANELVDKGITTIAQLRENQDQMLNDIQRIGLKYYEDILERIPRAEIEEYRKIFDNAFTANSSSKYEIVGSYRRGASDSGDIDVIITTDNPEVFKAFIDKLLEQKIIIEVLSRGPSKSLVITRLPNMGSVARRVDFLYSGPKEYPFAVLYFTGSKDFNTVMRQRAIDMGYTMNEHGLYKMDGKKKGDLVQHVFTSEKDIFDFLNMSYKSPEERIDSRSVKDKTVSTLVKEETVTAVIEPSIEEEEIVVIPVVKAKKTTTLKNKEKLVEKTKTKKTVSKKSKINLVDDESVISNINAFKKDGIQVLEGLLEADVTAMLNKANLAYRNLEPIMSDNEFDILQDFITEKFPDNQAVTQIGAPIEKNKAQLPYQMASMDKIKPDTNVLASWSAKYKGPYVLSCKLDGVSGLYTTEGTTGPKLYTRGDGKIGQDISYLIPLLRLPKKKDIVIRGEFIMAKKVFKEKYSSSFANARNLASGIVNRVTIDEKAKDLDFVAYEVIKPELKPSEQMAFLESIDVDIVLHKKTEALTNELLSELLIDWRANYSYEVDGVIVTDDKIYPRKTGNPEHSFAFKMVLSDQMAEAKVVDVIWEPSKDGYLKPRVKIEPIHLGGVKIEYATGFNGAFIRDNKIGIGALITMIRSGDVIPYIKSVTTPAEIAKFPSIPYKWNDTNIDIMLEDAASNETVREKVITGFFKGLEVDGLGGGNVARIIEAGYTTIPEILNMTVEDFMKVEGFKKKMAEKIYNGIQTGREKASLITIMSASNLIGRGLGERKLEPILEMYPNILTSDFSEAEKIQQLKQVKGMAGKSAELFVKNIPAFLAFLKECGLESKLATGPSPEILSSHPLFKKSVVMTGFRDEKIKDFLKKIGANLGSSVSKNTAIVLVKDKAEDTSKANEARKLGVTLMTPEEFMDAYF